MFPESQALRTWLCLPRSCEFYFRNAKTRPQTYIFSRTQNIEELTPPNVSINSNGIKLARKDQDLGSPPVNNPPNPSTLTGIDRIRLHIVVPDGTHLRRSFRNSSVKPRCYFPKSKYAIATPFKCTCPVKSMKLTRSVPHRDGQVTLFRGRLNR